jgi:hypothetical protein
MHPRNSLRLSIAVAFFAIVYSMPAAAQQYTILHAEYGTEHHHVDVTRRLREVARTHPRFRMGNSTFGIDPAPGRRKVLRIYARGPEGHRRMFEFPESSAIDGEMFSGWGRGDWGNGEWRGGWNGDDDHRDRDDDRR